MSPAQTPQEILAEYGFTKLADLHFKVETDEEKDFARAIKELQSPPKLSQLVELQETINGVSWGMELDLRYLLYHLALDQAQAAEEKKKVLFPAIKVLIQTLRKVEALLHEE